MTFFFSCYGDNRDLHVLTHSFPTRRSSDLRIADMSGQAAELGIGTLIYFAAVLSINLGLINLFPVPMLDGGHLLFYAVEALRGRPLGERAQEYGFRIGQIGRAHV